MEEAKAIILLQLNYFLLLILFIDISGESERNKRTFKIFICIKVLENYGTLYTIERFSFIFVDLKVLVGRKPGGSIPWSSYMACKTAEVLSCYTTQDQPLCTSHQNWNTKEIHCSGGRQEQRYKFTLFLFYFPDVSDMYS